MFHVFKIPAMKAIKVIECRDIDYETAKKEVAGYFQMKGEAYASEIEEDLELDYRLICQIMDELKREGALGGALMECYDAGDSFMATESEQRPGRSATQRL